jgi:predicted dehydrogenase
MQNRSTRRHFLMTSAAAAAVPTLFASPLLAHRRSPVEKLNVGVIGLGIRAGNLMKGHLLGDERVRIVAVCDVDRTRREHFKKLVDDKYGSADCVAYIEYRELLDREDIDAVVIATPDHWHVTQALHAIAAGKDVYCEKPLTHTLREGKLLIDAVKKHGTIFQTGSQQRSEFGHRFVQAVEYIRNGRIGEILNVNVGVGDPPRACDLPGEELEPGLDWNRWLGPAPEREYSSVLSPRGVIRHYPEWRSYWEYSGGKQADMGAHHFDIVQWALGADSGGPIEACPPRDGDPVRGATLHYANGVTVTHGGPSGATFIGTKGMIAVDRGRISSIPGNLFETAIAEEELHVPRNTSHMDNWIKCIEDRTAPICTAEIGARSAAVCQLLNLAYRHGRSMQWDPKAWRFVGDDQPREWMDYDRRADFELPG